VAEFLILLTFSRPAGGAGPGLCYHGGKGGAAQKRRRSRGALRGKIMTEENTPEARLKLKRAQFNAAMRLYEGRRRYKVFGKLVAAANVSLQAFLLYRASAHSLGPAGHLLVFALACLAADFVNGLVHMHTDCMDDYESLGGPLIANFHLHHKRPRYQDHPLPFVYFNESGSKVWLVPVLAAAALLTYAPGFGAGAAWGLAWFGVLSSAAEVSHYLAHNSSSRWVLLLGRARLLLDKRLHARHHLEDNVSYTFLNALTDPLADLVAKRFYPGYKRGTDLHYADYEPPPSGRVEET